MESVIKCLQKDYDILYTPKEVLGKVSAELISNLEYTTFMKSPISNKDVEYNMMEQSTKGKAACDIYLPALANSLDIHISYSKNWILLCCTSHKSYPDYRAEEN